MCISKSDGGGLRALQCVGKEAQVRQTQKSQDSGLAASRWASHLMPSPGALRCRGSCPPSPTQTQSLHMHAVCCFLFSL